MQASASTPGNTAYGTGALSTDGGDFNSAFGYNALHNNVGDDNAASGFGALGFNTTGNGNTAIGNNALGLNTTGGYNTAIGKQALISNTSGSSNIAVGMYALLYNDVGSFNTAIGYDALYFSTGNNNIAVGDGAGYNITTGSNNIDIGSGGGSSDNGVIRIGFSGQTTTMIAGIWNTTISGGVQVYVNKYGHLGTTTSSQRFKEDIQTIDASSDKLLKLRPVSFRYKQAADDGTKPLQYGLIAEEVAEVYPELVEYDAEGKPFTVYYNLLTPLMISELQKEYAADSVQQEELISQQAEIATLNQQLTAERAEMLAMLQSSPDTASLQQQLNELEQLSQAPDANGVAAAAKAVLATGR